jgi:hypothetical protein
MSKERREKEKKKKKLKGATAAVDEAITQMEIERERDAMDSRPGVVCLSLKFSSANSGP